SAEDVLVDVPTDAAGILDAAGVAGIRRRADEGVRLGLHSFVLVFVRGGAPSVQRPMSTRRAKVFAAEIPGFRADGGQMPSREFVTSRDLVSNCRPRCSSALTKVAAPRAKSAVGCDVSAPWRRHRPTRGSLERCS